MRRGVIVVGAQWGDEGKGKIVDLVAEEADVVVRYAGGPNAGHTLVVGGRKIVLRLVPSGILQERTRCLMGQGMVVDGAVLAQELAALEERGVPRARERLGLSDRAHLVLSVHRTIDGLREERASAEARIGTTKRGIGPCYEDKAARRGVRVCDLREPGTLAEKVARLCEAWAPVARALGGQAPEPGEVLAELEPIRALLLALSTDVSVETERAMAEDRRVLFEGAQGTLLDLDHGTYPFVTSSTAVAAGACTGAGVGPTRIGKVIGITKGYTTRVGAGPFPTELDDAIGERLRTRGGEFGSVTGRPRRTGWLDLVALRYAARVNGLTSLALTKLDVMTGLAEVKACVGYETAQGPREDLPLGELESAAPLYASLPGWSQPIEGARARADLPGEARDFVEFVERFVGVPVHLVSVGPGREETIVLERAFDER